MRERSGKGQEASAKAKPRETQPQRTGKSEKGNRREVYAKKDSSPPQFPHVEAMPDAGVAKFAEDVAWLGTVDILKWNEFESELPTVIGAVSPEEWEFLETVNFTDPLWSDEDGDRVTISFNSSKVSDQENVALLQSGMPKLMSILEADLRNFSPTAEWSFVKFDRLYTEAGDAPRGATNWHSDGNTLPRYVISGDNFMTECYTGEASMKTSVLISVDSAREPIAAPARGILRISPKNIHRTPVFTEGADRTFITFMAREPK